MWNFTSVVDPCRCLTSPDRYPATDPDASSVADKMPARNKFVVFVIKVFMLIIEGTFTSFFKDKKSKRSHEILEITALWVYAC